MSSPAAAPSVKRTAGAPIPGLKCSTGLLVTVLTVSLSSLLLIIYLWNSGSRPMSVPVSALSQCICPMIYAPVCDVSGATQPNACSARCRGLEVQHEGACDQEPQLPEHCKEGCSDTFAPVCGTNKLTYLNPCVAECSKMEVLRKGVCSSTMIIKPKPVQGI